MTDDSQAKLAELKAQLVALQGSVGLSSVTDDRDDVVAKMARLDEQFNKLAESGYAHLQPLKARLTAVRSGWAAAQANIEAQVDYFRKKLDKETQRASRMMVSGQSGDGGDPLAAAEEKIGSLGDETKSIESQFSDWLSPFTGALYGIENEANRAAWSIEEWSETAARPGPGESLLMAAKAEWVVSGRDKDDPDGVLYLTNQNLMFEQKEKKGGFLGMGSKAVQQLEWVVPLSSINQIRAENKGMLGGKDMVYLSCGAGAPHAEITLEVKGGVDCEVWQRYIAQAKAGQPLFAGELDKVLPEVPAVSADALAELDKADAQMAEHGAAALGNLRKSQSPSALDALGASHNQKPEAPKSAMKEAPHKPQASGKSATVSSAADAEDDGPAEHNPFKNNKGGSPFQNKKDK